MNAQILAALIASAPGWAGVVLAMVSNRRALTRQTRVLKAHSESLHAACPAPARDPVVAWHREPGEEVRP